MRPGSKAVSSDLSVTYNPTAQTLLPHERQEEILANRGKRCSRGCGCDRGRRCRCDRVAERQLDIRQVVLGNARQRVGNTTAQAVAGQGQRRKIGEIHQGRRDVARQTVVGQVQGLQGGNTAQISRHAARQPVVGEVQDLQAGQRAQANRDTARELVVGDIQGLQTCEPAQGGRDAACQCLATDIQLQPDHPLRGPVNGYPLPGVNAAGLTPVQAHGGTDASLQGFFVGQEQDAVSDQVGIGRGVGYDSAIGTCGSLC